MANQKQNFTPEMRKATDPNSPPGGSRLVRGREPTVVGQANMMSSFAHDDSVPLEDPVSGTSSNAPSVPPSPNTGFFDEEYKDGKRTGSPPTTARTNQSADSGKRTNQDAGLGPSLPPHPPKRTSTKVGTLSTNTDPPLSEPINRCVGLLLREGEAFTRTSIDIDLESPEECRQLSDRIYHSLMFENWKPDLKAQHIPSRQRDAIVHDTLSRLLADREKTELRLNELTTNEHPDGTRRDRDEDVVETTYQRLQTRYNNFNRAMLTIYAQFLSSLRICRLEPLPQTPLWQCWQMSPLLRRLRALIPTFGIIHAHPRRSLNLLRLSWTTPPSTPCSPIKCDPVCKNPCPTLCGLWLIRGPRTYLSDNRMRTS